MITGDDELTCNLPFNEIINNEITIDYSQNWNLISLPVQTNEYPCVTMDGSTLYGFEEGGYVNTDLNAMEIGSGYWLRFEEDETCAFSGQLIYETSININEGWNLIGSISFSVDLNTIVDIENLIVPGTVYSFTPNGYSEEVVLDPGKGYWVRANNSGSIILISE